MITAVTSTTDTLLMITVDTLATACTVLIAFTRDAAFTAVIIDTLLAEDAPYYQESMDS